MWLGSGGGEEERGGGRVWNGLESRWGGLGRVRLCSRRCNLGLSRNRIGPVCGGWNDGTGCFAGFAGYTDAGVVVVVVGGGRHGHGSHSFDCNCHNYQVLGCSIDRASSPEGRKVRACSGTLGRAGNYRVGHGAWRVGGGSLVCNLAVGGDVSSSHRRPKV